MTAILRASYIASAYSMPVRERELELNSVKKSNTSGSGKALCTDFYGGPEVHTYSIFHLRFILQFNYASAVHFAVHFCSSLFSSLFSSLCSSLCSSLFSSLCSSLFQFALLLQLSSFCSITCALIRNK